MTQQERNSLCTFLYANRLFLPARACPVWNALLNVRMERSQGIIFDLDAFYSRWDFPTTKIKPGKIGRNHQTRVSKQWSTVQRPAVPSITETRNEVILTQLRCSRSKSTIVAFEAGVSRAFSKAGTYGRKCKKCNASGKSTWCHCIFQQVWMVFQHHEQRQQGQRLGNPCAVEAYWKSQNKVLTEICLPRSLRSELRCVKKASKQMWCHCRSSCTWTGGPSPLVVPVDNKHRGSWLTTLNSARSWQMTSLNPAEDNSLTYATHLKQDVRTLQRCYNCRRIKYAKACLATNVSGNRLLTRWQEWCLPLLPHTSAHSVSDILCMFEPQMADLLGVALLSIKGLCRTAAGLAIYVSECMCNYDVMTDLNGFSAVVPNRKLVLPHSLSPSVSNPLDARLTTLRKVTLPCRRVGQRRIGRLKRRRHKISNRTNKNVEAELLSQWLLLLLLLLFELFFFINSLRSGLICWLFLLVFIILF